MLRTGKHLFTHVRRGVRSRAGVNPESPDRMPPVRLLPDTSRAALVLLLSLVVSAPVGAQSLRGSTASLDRQNRIARQHDYTYIDNGDRVRYFAERGWLVRIRANADFDMHAVSFPYARPEVELFLKRLGRQYRRACGETLVVTSLTRPHSRNRQIRNASDRSVHPTGMAVDLRYSRDRNCRRWLEGVLLDLERAGILEATLERRPVHYHVALFPRQYSGYVEALEARQAAQQTEYTVRRGDSLWGIARSHGVSVTELRSVNDLNGSRIYPGQILAVPLGS